MSPVTTAWGARLDELLADDEWHDIDEVVAVLAPLVPPGVAYRHMELRRRGARGDGRTSPATRVQGNTATATASGQRDRARKCITDRVKRGTVQRDGSQIRRRP